MIFLNALCATEHLAADFIFAGCCSDVQFLEDEAAGSQFAIAVFLGLIWMKQAPIETLMLGHSKGSGPEMISLEQRRKRAMVQHMLYSEQLYEGILFPIGCRAELVKQTILVIVPTARKCSRAFARHRIFIRVVGPDATCPGTSDYNEKRSPSHVIRIVTQTSPDIVNPTEEPLVSASFAFAGRLFANDPGLVFWPRRADAVGSHVEFKVTIDCAPTESALIFVDNVAMQQTDLMWKLKTLAEAIFDRLTFLCPMEKRKALLGFG